MTNEEAIEELMYLKHMVREDSNADKVLDMAIEALKQNWWIPCSERLPNPTEHSTVLVTDREGKVRSTRALYVITVREVFIAWRPLPKPWKGERAS